MRKMEKEKKALSQQHLKAIEGVKDRIAGIIGTNERAYDIDGYTLDYSPGSLRLFERHNPADGCRDEFVRVNGTFLTNMSVLEGAVLGEVIIRNLGGEWVYPPFWRIVIFSALRGIGIPLSIGGRIMFPEIQVMLNGKMIPVMTIGRLRVKWNKRIFSLSNVYEEIKATGGWSGKIAVTPLKRRILKEKKQMWRIEKWSWLYDPREHSSRTLNQFIRRIMFDREFIRTGEGSGGGDYSPDGLRGVDDFFSKQSFEERMKAPEIQKIVNNERGRKNFSFMFHRGVGGYLGELIVRRLGGQWVYPTHRDYLDGLKKQESVKYLHDRCFVKLGDNLIPVMTIAQLRLEGKIPSLLRVYEEIKHTGKWSGNPPANP